MLKKEMKRLFERKEEKAGYDSLPHQSSRPLMDWEIIFGRQIVLKDGSVDFTNKILQAKKYIGFFFADFSNKSATSASLPLANTLVQYYVMLKDLGADGELEVISVDITDSMNVTYSRYYLDFPWLMVDISNLLLRQSLIQDYYTSTTVPQLVLLNRFGEVVDSSTQEKIESFLNDKLISLETVYPNRESHDYDVYTSYNNDETIPILPASLPASRTLSTENNDRRQDSFEDNKNIISPQTRPISVDMTRSKPNSSDNGATATSDRESVRKSNKTLSKIVHSFYGENGVVSTSNDLQQQPARYSMPNPSLASDGKSERRVEVKPLTTTTAADTVRTFQSVSNDTVSSIDTIRVKQLLRLLPTLPTITRTKKYIESAILFYVINARKEVDMIDIIINELQEQQKYYPPIKKEVMINKKLLGQGIIEINERIYNYERIITRITYNEQFPLFSLGYPNIKWEKDIIKELHIINYHYWESRLQSLYYHEGDETIALLSSLQMQYQEEYWRYCLELLHWCKIERIEREAIARRFEFIAIVVACVIGLCVPVIVGVVIGVYANN